MPEEERIPVRVSLHPAITEERIAELVSRFYAEIRQHPRLGPIFEHRLAGRWDAHLQKMEFFWQSVLMHNGTYKGKPLPAHLRLKELVPQDYPVWLSVFAPVAAEVFGREAGELVTELAARIARNLQFASFYDGSVSSFEAASGLQIRQVPDA